jgi:hypothetical protein
MAAGIVKFHPLFKCLDDPSISLRGAGHARRNLWQRGLAYARPSSN